MNTLQTIQYRVLSSSDVKAAATLYAATLGDTALSVGNQCNNSESEHLIRKALLECGMLDESLSVGAFDSGKMIAMCFGHTVTRESIGYCFYPQLMENDVNLMYCHCLKNYARSGADDIFGTDNSMIEINALRVQKDYRKNGIGTELVCRVIENGRLHGHKVFCAASNTHISKKIFNNLGFQAMKVIKTSEIISEEIPLKYDEDFSIYVLRKPD